MCKLCAKYVGKKLVADYRCLGVFNPGIADYFSDFKRKGFFAKGVKGETYRVCKSGDVCGLGV